MPQPPYISPLNDFRATLDDIAAPEDILALEPYKDFTPDLLDAVLEEAAKFAAEELAPLNETGDRSPSRIKDGVVTTPEGFKEAYKKFIANGWNAAPFPADSGGQGLPRIITTLLSEMWSAANMAFGLCPLLTHGAVELLSQHGSDKQKATFLPKLVSGEWTGTMCMTEPQAGSDVGAVTTRAIPEGDHYRITGTKIFITYGDHDFTDNIIHMVLARLPDAEPGTKGLSLFLVPKILVNADGSLGNRNDVTCVSLEHKLGIHASPTAVLSFGDNGGAIGTLIGQPGRGIHAMFTMMNSARLSVGIEGVATTARAYDIAKAYAEERIQGRAIGGKEPITIDQHSDVQRMLNTMESHSLALRGLALYASAAMDRAHYHTDETIRIHASHTVDLLIPIIKANATDIGFEMASECIQVHGGMGYIEESGAPQLLRDARIAQIYEGTNGIQALDLVMRKLQVNDGKFVHTFLDEIGQGADPQLTKSLDRLRTATTHVQSLVASDPNKAAAVATPYLRLAGITLEAVMLAKLSDKKEQYKFFKGNILPTTLGLSEITLSS